MQLEHSWNIRLHACVQHFTSQQGRVRANLVLALKYVVAGFPVSSCVDLTLSPSCTAVTRQQMVISHLERRVA
jgi:hypothetical protein